MNGDFDRSHAGRPTANGSPTWKLLTNTFAQIKVFNVNTGAIQVLTSDRYNSFSPAWSSDGKWLYFLSDRMLKTAIPSPWGPRQPDPYFDRSMKVYELALTPGLRSPFAPVGRTAPGPAGEAGRDEARQIRG